MYLENAAGEDFFLFFYVQSSVMARYASLPSVDLPQIYLLSKFELYISFVVTWKLS